MHDDPGTVHVVVLVKRVGVAVASVTDSIENEQAASARRLVGRVEFPRDSKTINGMARST